MTPSYVPTARQERCLHAALLAGDAARDAWRQVVSATPLDQLDPGCRSILPLVYRNLARQSADDRDQIEALKARYLLAWSDNQRALDAALPLLRGFEEAGVEAVALKGLALIARFYRDAGARAMADVDVLVRPADVGRASDVAVGLGWRPRYRLTPGFLRVKHAGPFDHSAGVACDVHWRLFEESGAERADADLWTATDRVELRGSSLRVLSPADQLLHVCGHAGRWETGRTIRWVADAVAILREAPIDWPRLLAQTRERRFVLRMRHMLGYLRRAFDAGVPTAVEAELEREPVSLLERLEHSVRTREHRVLGELPTYVFNCLRAEPRPLRALPGFLRDAWGLESLGGATLHAMALAGRRLRGVVPGVARNAKTPRPGDGAPR